MEESTQPPASILTDRCIHLAAECRSRERRIFVPVGASQLAAANAARLARSPLVSRASGLGLLVAKRIHCVFKDLPYELAGFLRRQRFKLDKAGEAHQSLHSFAHQPLRRARAEPQDIWTSPEVFLGNRDGKSSEPSCTRAFKERDEVIFVQCPLRIQKP